MTKVSNHNPVLLQALEERRV